MSPLKKSVFRKSCRLCGSKNLNLIIKMPSSQPVDNFRPAHSQKLSLELFDMDLYQCKKCGHAQLLNIVSPNILYGDYIYKSSSSPDLKEHFSNYSDFLFAENYIKKNEKILDIGCNDGLFLDYLKKKKVITYGIDQAKIFYNICKKKGHKIFSEYLNLNSAKRIKKKISKFKVITANNVFSHSDNLSTMLKSADFLLDKEGFYIFEVSYLFDTIRNNVIDYIYHEHLSYHSIKSLVPFLKKSNFFIYDVVKLPTKGGSIRVICGKNKFHENVDLINSMISAENDANIYSLKKYIEISKEIKKSKNLINNWLFKKKIIEKGYRCFGYGACATGTVLSKMLKLDRFLNGIIDDNKSRQGLLSPNTFLPVVSLESLKKEKKIIIIILAWRHKEKILEKLKKTLSQNILIVLAKPNMKSISSFNLRSN